MSPIITIPPAMMAYIQSEAERMHHGRIIIEINSDKPDRIDVKTEIHERFSSVVRAK